MLNVQYRCFFTSVFDIEHSGFDIGLLLIFHLEQASACDPHNKPKQTLAPDICGINVTKKRLTPVSFEVNVLKITFATVPSSSAIK